MQELQSQKNPSLVAHLEDAEGRGLIEAEAGEGLMALLSFALFSFFEGNVYLSRRLGDFSLEPLGLELFFRGAWYCHNLPVILLNLVSLHTLTLLSGNIVPP